MSAPVAVLGGGSWGTALAWLLSGQGIPVRLWLRDAAHAEEVQASRVNRRYLPDLRLPEPLRATAELRGALEGAETVVLAVPAQAVRELLGRCREQLPPSGGIVLAAKGLERGTGRRLSLVSEEVLGAAKAGRVAVLSGPNLSGEIVRGIPSASVIATEDSALARGLQELFSTSLFRVYTNRDVTGVELGGALKNPIAIASGICDGLGFGNNTKASLLTRGLAEMTRLGVAAGARAETFSGLSGLGDLIATAASPLSRNYRVGFALGQGESLRQAQDEVHQTAEGVPTTEAACRLASELGVEVPILSELYRVLFEGRAVAEAVEYLMSRPYRDEGQLD
ncbi:MAG: NAD(P)H-dependent glycerol-3-phosphate dehydrogenase [Armatimonadota bacterium]